MWSLHVPTVRAETLLENQNVFRNSIIMKILQMLSNHKLHKIDLQKTSIYVQNQFLSENSTTVHLIANTLKKSLKFCNNFRNLIYHT